MYRTIAQTLNLASEICICTNNIIVEVLVRNTAKSSSYTLKARCNVAAQSITLVLRIHSYATTRIRRILSYTLEAGCKVIAPSLKLVSDNNIIVEVLSK